MSESERAFWRDAVERIVVSFVEAGVASALVDLQDGSIGLDGVKVAAIAGLTAALTLAKTQLARWFASRNTASFVDVAPSGDL